MAHTTQSISFDTACIYTTVPEWEKLMKGARKASYNNVKRLIKKYLPALYEELALSYPNPYAGQTQQTENHYILVHSAIEYFLRKEF